MSFRTYLIWSSFIIMPPILVDFFSIEKIPLPDIKIVYEASKLFQKISNWLNYLSSSAVFPPLNIGKNIFRISGQKTFQLNPNRYLPTYSAFVRSYIFPRATSQSNTNPVKRCFIFQLGLYRISGLFFISGWPDNRISGLISGETV